MTLPSSSFKLQNEKLMKRPLVAVLVTTAFLIFSPMIVSAGYYQGDEEAALKEMVRELANAAVNSDLNKLDRMQTDDFRGNAHGIGFDKKMLRAALQSREMVVATWSVYDVIVKITGNTAAVTGRSTLTNAKYKGMDLSGDWEWSNRFVKQRGGGWRIINSQAKLIKK
jgi:ketosteroid isomerase-like protein